MDSGVVLPKTEAVAPLKVSVVPVTCTMFVAGVSVPVVAVTLMVRFVGSPPVVRSTVAVPVTSVVLRTT
jgi:hypothetical protein